ncbi:MAG: Eco57I restriction-modification methylase domain-containing protein [Candidatus Helarchaeota archaeon]
MTQLNKDVKHKIGIYYTPNYITDYMCKSILNNFLIDIFRGEFKEIDEIFNIIDKSKLNHIINKLNNLKVLDPSCGNGAFLTKFAQLLYDYKKKLSSNLESTFDELNEKIWILKNNIYGIDIQKQAIISLGKKFYSWIFNEFEQNTPKFVDFIENINLTIANSLVDDIFPDIIKTGFDIVIGNPPFIDSEEMTKSNRELRTICSKKYITAHGNWDLYCIFIELGLNCLKNGGRLAYIIPNKLLCSEYAKATRELLKKYKIECIRDYTNIRVFDAAVYPIIIFLKKESSADNDKIFIEIMNKSNTEIPIVSKINKVDLDLFVKNNNWSILLSQSKANLIKIMDNSINLGEIFEIFGGATVSEAYQIKDILIEYDNHLDSTYFKFINTGTIDKYVSLWGLKMTKYIKNSYKKPIVLKTKLKSKFPNRYLQAKSEKIIIGGLTKELEAYYDSGDYLAGKSTVIIINKNKNNFNLNYLCALLNSSLINSIYKLQFENLSLRGGYLRVGPPQIKNLKIPNPLLNNTRLKEQIIEYLETKDISPTIINRINDLVLKICNLNKSDIIL